MDLSIFLDRLTQRQTLDLAHDEQPPEGFRAAAVIVPLVERSDGVNLIFNKRAAHLDNHAGQVSFPGGRRDQGDETLLATALRELEEELGIFPSQHRPLSRLPARPVISNYFVTPFISHISAEANITPEPGEVAYAFEVPLSYLIQPDTAQEVEREIFGTPRIFYTWEYAGETIWGATGRIIGDFLCALGVDHIKPSR